MCDPQFCPRQGAPSGPWQFFECFDIEPGFDQTADAQLRLADQFLELRNA
jgi:hypothetical protein